MPCGCASLQTIGVRCDNSTGCCIGNSCINTSPAVCQTLGGRVATIVTPSGALGYTLIRCEDAIDPCPTGSGCGCPEGSPPTTAVLVRGIGAAVGTCTNPFLGPCAACNQAYSQLQVSAMVGFFNASMVATRPTGGGAGCNASPFLQGFPIGGVANCSQCSIQDSYTMWVVFTGSSTPPGRWLRILPTSAGNPSPFIPPASTGGWTWAGNCGFACSSYSSTDCIDWATSVCSRTCGGPGYYPCCPDNCSFQFANMGCYITCSSG